MQTDSVDVHALAEELVQAMPTLDEPEQRVALAVYRLLAEGAPVPPDRVAERAGAEPDTVRGLLEAWPGVYSTDGRVVGFWGLALEQMPHRLYVDGRELRAWCAWDTLFLPELIDKPATVESPCPLTGDLVSLQVIPGEGVVDLSPPTAVLSFLRREEPFDADTILTFCHFVHFLRDEQAGNEWVARHDDVFLLSIEDGFEIARLANRARFPVR